MRKIRARATRVRIRTRHVVGVRKGVFPGVPRGGGAHRFSCQTLHLRHQAAAALAA
ncbi:hypothetical protein CBM2637_B20049 [Cupriavidus taiwanensis]|nr:hypothetical protein CBM2637_B20049 [Cupriavidus taiwanensis]